MGQDWVPPVSPATCVVLTVGKMTRCILGSVPWGVAILTRNHPLSSAPPPPFTTSDCPGRWPYPPHKGWSSVPLCLLIPPGRRYPNSSSLPDTGNGLWSFPPPLLVGKEPHFRSLLDLNPSLWDTSNSQVYNELPMTCNLHHICLSSLGPERAVRTSNFKSQKPWILEFCVHCGFQQSLELSD